VSRLSSVLLRIPALLIVFAMGVLILGHGDWASTAFADHLRGHVEDHEHESPGLPNFDIRDGFPREAEPDAEQLEAIRQLGPAVMVRWDDLFGTPKLIISHGGFLTERDNRSPEEVALAFIEQDNLFKFDPEPEPPIILSTVDTRDDRPIVIGRAYNTAHNQTAHVFLEQRRAGLRVFGAVLNFTIDAAGRIAVIGAHYDRNGAPSGAPLLTAEEAILAAAAFGGVEDLDVELVETGASGPVRFFENPFLPPGTFRPSAITAEPVVFPMPFGHENRFGWRIEIEIDHEGFYNIVVDAVSGELLYRHNYAHADGPQGTVYQGQNPCVPQPVPCATPGTPVVTPFTGVNGSWVDVDTTAGNNAIAFHDLDGNSVVGYQPTSAAQHFDFTYTDAIASVPPGTDGTDVVTDRDFVITQAFYYVNMLQERYYQLGFDEAAGNFQEDNFGKGGAGGDPVLVHVDWGFNVGSCCNASMATPGDGSSPRLRLRVGLDSGGNLNMHRAMNGDTVAHEFGHGVSNRLVGGGSMGSGVQTGALGEGWSDALATSLWHDPVYGEYNNGNLTTGIRGVAYDTSTLVYSDLCSGGCQVHNDGRIWATAMWQMRTALIGKYGQAAGTVQHERLMLDGMKNTPTNPSYLDARDGILAADVTNNGGENQCMLWGVFAAREMGFSASSSGNSATVTPASDAHPDCYPTADANGPYETDEGVAVALDGSGSTPSTHVSGGAIVAYEWDFDGDGQFDDATGATPLFDLVGQDGVFTVTLRVTNAVGLTDEDSATVTVHNVLPSVSLNSDAPVDENSPVTVSGVISDPGWLEVLSGTIDWGDGLTPVQPIVGVLENDPPEATLTFSMSHIYGDNGTFTVTVCGSDDHGTVCEMIDVQIDNVDPTAEIDKSSAILINGVPTILATIGDSVDFAGRSTDPGSDDLLLVWDWGDGTSDATLYLVNPPDPDPFPSPTIQPRDVTDLISHTFTDACHYVVSFHAEDDDGGISETDTVDVIIVGDADRARSQGFWSQQFRTQGRQQFDEATLLCYLAIVGFMSEVFDEVRDASTLASAHEVLTSRPNEDDMRVLLDVQLLAAWLNFANGAIGYDELVPSMEGGPADTPFSDVIAAAEAVRLNPAATRAELEEQKNILEAINLRDGG
jgi:hypothetical protein